MSYATFDNRVVVKFELSEALEEAVFTPGLGLVEVSYSGNPDMYYEHYECNSRDFHELYELVEYHQSGYKGYKVWKERRRVDYEAQNRRKFEAFWRELNDYEKLALVEWAGDKKWGAEWFQLTKSIKSKKRQRS